jgi:hypothetical protein
LAERLTHLADVAALGVDARLGQHHAAVPDRTLRTALEARAHRRRQPRRRRCDRGQERLDACAVGEVARVALAHLGQARTACHAPFAASAWARIAASSCTGRRSSAASASPRCSAACTTTRRSASRPAAVQYNAWMIRSATA